MALPITPFRLFLIALLGLVAWFALFSENNNRYRRAAVSTVSDVAKSCIDKGKIAVTFDEGPSSTTTNVLTGLTNAQIPATFHVVTKYFSNIVVSTNLKTAAENGHVIGLRFPTETDPTKLSDRELKEVLLYESYKIFKQIGAYPKYLRLPLGKYNDKTVRVATQLGFIISEWNVDTNDYAEGITGDDIVKAYSNQLASVGTGSGRFISLHRDLYAVYSDEGILTKIRKVGNDKGYTFVTLADCLGDSSYRPDNKDPSGEVSEDFARKKYEGLSESTMLTPSSVGTILGLLLALIFA